MYLTESLYTKGLQCLKYLWLQLHKPELLSVSDPDIKPGREAGEDVDLLARNLFPEGLEISASCMEERIHLTKQYLDTGPVTLFNAAFESEGMRVVIDVLESSGSGRAAFHRIKGITRIRKPHIRELSLQYYILTALGLDIESAGIICLNKAYIREGELEPAQLYLINDLTRELEEMQKDLPEVLKQMHALKDGPLPDLPIGLHCSSPRLCEARELCWKNIPSPSVFDISTLSPELKMKYYNRGIVEFHQIEDDKDLSAHQRLQVECELSGRSHRDEKELIRFLSTLSWPISHLDFEAFQQAVPLWEGIRPYSHIPFQYSLHVEEEDGSLLHKEFLADPGEDPRRKLAEMLIEDCPAEGTVLVYNQAFEKGILKALSVLYPDLSDPLNSISDRIVDLMIPFRNKYCYSPAMGGKYSIKKVLPALVPEMADAYRKLKGVHNGLEAMHTFSEMDKTDSEKRSALLEYCELDTMAMVEILRALKEIIRTSPSATPTSPALSAETCENKVR